MILVGEIVLAGKLKRRKDMVVDLTVVAVEHLAADTGDRQRMDLAQEYAAGIELMTAQLGHEAAASAIVETPADQFLHALVAVLANIRFQPGAIVRLDVWFPAVTQHRSAVGIDDRFAVLVQFWQG